MKLTPQQAEKLLRGNHTFSQLGFSMMLTRLKGMYANDPSQEVLQSAAGEMNAFISKFEKIMAKDCLIISEL